LKKANSPLGLVPGLFGMGGLLTIWAALSKKKTRVLQSFCRRAQMAAAFRTAIQSIK